MPLIFKSSSVFSLAVDSSLNVYIFVYNSVKCKCANLFLLTILFIENKKKILTKLLCFTNRNMKPMLKTLSQIRILSHIQGLVSAGNDFYYTSGLCTFQIIVPQAITFRCYYYQEPKVSNHINLTDIRGWRGSEIKSEIENFVAIVNKNWATILQTLQVWGQKPRIQSLGITEAQYQGGEGAITFYN